MAILLKDSNGVPIPQVMNKEGTGFIALKGEDNGAYTVVYRGTYEIVSTVIAAGQSLSGVVQNKGFKYITIVMPPSWTAANLTFQGSADGTNFYNVFMDGTEVEEVAAAGRCIVMNTNALALTSLPYFKIRSGTSGNPQNQAAERTLTVIMSY